MAPFFMYVGISLLYASVAGALVSFVEPLAAGSGIAEVKTYLNGIHIRGLLAVSNALRQLPCACHKTCCRPTAGLHGCTGAPAMVGALTSLDLVQAMKKTHGEKKVPLA